MARADQVAKDPQGYLAGRWWKENAMHPESHLPTPIFSQFPDVRSYPPLFYQVRSDKRFKDKKCVDRLVYT